MTNFNQNWNFAERYMEQIKNILQRNAMHIVKIEVAKPEEDMKQATDLKIKITAGDVAVRVRRGKQQYRDITIRAYKNGYKTEIHKLREGFGDWYLYAWEDEAQTKICEYALFDINKARQLFLADRKIIMNKDGKSGFVTYQMGELKNISALMSHERI